MPTVYPTSTCFDDAIEILKKLLEAHPNAFPTNKYLIVHAIVAPYGEPFAHAWIEDNVRSRVMFMGILDGKREMFAADRAEYYADIKMQELTKYTPLEAVREEKRTGQFGPWEQKYRELSGRG